MESLFAKIREMQTNWDSMRNSFQTNGTPIRSGMKVVREAVENSYNEAIVTAHGVEENVDNLTSRIDQFRIHNAAIANYCLVHPSTAIFGSAGAIAIPSYLGKPCSVR